MGKSDKYPIIKTKKSFINLSGKLIDVFITKQNKVISVTIKNKSNIFLRIFWYLLLIFNNIVCLLLNLFTEVIFTCILLVLLYQMIQVLFCINEETFDLIQPLGYQMTSKYTIGQKSSFIPFNKVQSIFINEVILKQRVIYILTILAKEETKDIIIPLFTESEPRLDCLDLVYKSIFGNSR